VIRRICGAIAVLAALIGVTACGGGGSTSSSTDNFELLFVGDLSGPTKIYGEAQLNGLEAAAAYLNESDSGINGRKIVIKTVDYGGQTSAAASQYLRYISEGNSPDAVYAGAESDATAALLPLLAQEGRYGFAQTDGNGLLAKEAGKKFPQQFDSGNSFPPIAQAAVEWFKEKGVHKVGVLQQELSYPEGEYPYLKEAFEKAGISYTLATFPAEATDVTPQLEKLKGAGVEAIYGQALGPAVGITLQGRSKMGWQVPILGDVAFAAADLPELVSPSDLGEVWLVVPFSVPSTSKSKGLDLLAQYMRKAGVSTPPGTTYSSVSEAWDGLIMTAAAVKQAGSSDADEVGSALEEMEEPKQEAYASQAEMAFSDEDHTNIKLTPADMPIVTPGPIIEGRLHSRSYP
jgi:branched-chain amino acid transport system substrate-binding protein